jgi:hypothetical protein
MMRMHARRRRRRRDSGLGKGNRGCIVIPPTHYARPGSGAGYFLFPLREGRMT